jgi:hypothetical protein
MAQPAHEPAGPGPVRPMYTAPTPARRWSWANTGVRLILTLLGAAGVIVSAFLNWIRGVDGVNLDIRTLWQSNVGQTTNTFVETVGFAAIVVGLVAILGMAPRSGWLTRLAGAVGVAGFVLFLIQVYRIQGENLDAGDVQVGAWLLLAGSIVMLIGGFFRTRTAVVAPAGSAVVEGS